jgi:hypothetical protein
MSIHNLRVLGFDIFRSWNVVVSCMCLHTLSLHASSLSMGESIMNIVPRFFMYQRVWVDCRFGCVLVYILSEPCETIDGIALPGNAKQRLDIRGDYR